MCVCAGGGGGGAGYSVTINRPETRLLPLRLLGQNHTSCFGGLQGQNWSGLLNKVVNDNY